MVKEQKGHVLFTQSGKIVDREELQSAVEEQLKAAPEEASLNFTIRPLGAGEEFSRVIDKLARPNASDCCAGASRQ